MFKLSIPTISDEELMKRYQMIKPVFRRNGKLHYFREFTFDEICNTSYIWDYEEDLLEEEINEKELVPLIDKDFECLHSFGYCGLFKPSVAEVLAQINPLDIPFIYAFEIIDSPKTASDFYKSSLTRIALENGFHVSTVRLYSKKQ